MPAWVRVTLGLFGIAMLRLAHLLAEPMLTTGWTWTHGFFALVPLALGIDALHAAVRKRWPLVFFADLVIAWLVSGRVR